ncbi:hypothetical protein LTS17_002572 [Exophiala oligosperma]
MTTDWSQLRQMRRWPGQNSSLEKVPTELIYSGGNTVQLWGAECKALASQDERIRTKRLFKNAMSTRDVGPAAHGHEVENARRYFKDFLTQVHAHVEASLAKQINDFKKLRIEYVFSVPTTWNRDADTLNEVKQTIREVVGKTQYRRGIIGMSEAAASAVETGQDRFKKGDVVLVCDTGGGTADVNIFKFVSSEREAGRIKPLTYDEGAPAGAASIDQAALDHLISKMRSIENLGKDSVIWALEAVQAGFSNIKHDYGRSKQEGYYLLPVPGMNGLQPPSEDFELGGKGSQEICFRIRPKLLEEWFNTAVNDILAIIDSQLEALAREHKGEKIDRVVLSGGFAWNVYYQDRMKAYFSNKKREKHRSISLDLDILTAPEPELSVVQGLVHNRVRELKGLGPIFESVCCPVSYGVVFAERYNSLKHSRQGDVPEISALDGKKYIQGQIDWIIKKGIPIPSKGIKREYDIVLNENAEKLPRSFQIVTTDHPRDRLPPNVSHSAVKPVCEITIDLTKLKVTNKPQSTSTFGVLSNKIKASTPLIKRSISNATSGPAPPISSALGTSGGGSGTAAATTTPTTKETSFDLFLLVGASDLRFEIKPRGEPDILASSEHDQIDVVWAQDDTLTRTSTATSRTDDLLLKRS